MGGIVPCSQGWCTPAEDKVALATQRLQRLRCLDAAHQAVQVVRVVLQCACSNTHMTLPPCLQPHACFDWQTDVCVWYMTCLCQEGYLL